MIEHADRPHATWAASSTAANTRCAGRLAMIAGARPQPESIHAARGTACHQISEKCLTTGKEPSDFLGGVEKTKEHDIEVDDEIVSSAAVYVEYVRETSIFSLLPLWVEQRFSLASLNPPFDAGGTADAVIYHEDDRMLEVIDLKAGMGVVEVNDNGQLRTYALGALLANPGLKVERITVTIVQPRAPHRDGRIRSETFHVADLIDWTTELLAAMNRAKHAMDCFDLAMRPEDQRDYVGMSKSDWEREFLRPGRCKFCPVEATCPANRRERLERVEPKIVERWFEDVTPVRNAVELTEAEQVAKDLEGLDALEDWIKARRAHAHALAERGVSLPGWVLVDKVGTRKWATDDTDKLVRDLGMLTNETTDNFFERKLKSPAAIDKLLGKAGAAKITNLWHRPVSGTNLVREDKTNRPAAKTVAERHFTPGA